MILTVGLRLRNAHHFLCSSRGESGVVFAVFVVEIAREKLRSVKGRSPSVYC